MHTFPSMGGVGLLTQGVDYSAFGRPHVQASTLRDGIARHPA